MIELAIDVETFSSVDLSKCGVYKYVESPDFEVLLMAYSYNKEPVKIIDFASYQDVPYDILKCFNNPDVLCTAWNASFERTTLSKWLGIKLPPEFWQCSMVKASSLGLPMSLGAAAKVLKLEDEKDSKGKALIRYFSVPCKPSKANKGRTRNMPEHAPDKWQEYKDYNVKDVIVEQAIRDKISFFAMPENEKKLWCLDQKINDEGVLLDPVLFENAIQIDTIHRNRLTEEAINLTGLTNPNSAAQLKEWLSKETDTEITSLTKTDIPVLLENTEDKTVKRVLEIRQEMSKTSIKKYEAMRKAMCNDNRARGLLQFYGASRTGRHAGRLIQIQNLPKNKAKDIHLARELVVSNDSEMLEMLYGNVPDILSQLVRTAFIAPKGSRLIVSDFRAIEARVIAWLAGEQWRLDVFNTHGNIYEASAAQMFKVPIESVTEGSPLRNKGKMAELALGYQGGPNAIIKIEISNRTPEKNRIPESELPDIVALWRQSNKKIVALWKMMNNAAIEALQGGKIKVCHGIHFYTSKGSLFMGLPSGRALCYYNATLRPNDFGGMSVNFEGLNQTTKQWQRQNTYGGSLVENATQAIARDCLMTAMQRLDSKGYKIIMHVHDEVVLEVPEGVSSIKEVNQILSEPIPWAKGLPLAAAGFETKYYKKD